MKAFAGRWGPPLLWAAAIFAASSRSSLPHLPSLLGWDKLQHWGAYGMLGLLLARATRGGFRGALLALALGALYGASDEVHQLFVRNRTFDPHDWLADTLGVLAGVGLWHLYQHHTHARAAAMKR